MKRLKRPPDIRPKGQAVIEILQKSSEYLDKITEVNNKFYPYWDKWKYYAKDWKIMPEESWYLVKSVRNDNFMNWIFIWAVFSIRMN